MKKLGLSLLIVLAISAFKPIIVKAEKVTFVTGANSPPYTYVENNIIVGLNIDIVNEVCTRLNLEPEIRREPWKRCLRTMEQAEADGIISPAYNKERTRFLHYPSESLGSSIKTIIIIPVESDIKITELNDIKNKNIGVVTKYSYGSEFDNFREIKKEYCADEKELYKLLDLKRLDAAVTREIPFRYLTKKLGLQDRFRIAYVLSDQPLYVAFSKSCGNKCESLTKKFSQVLKQMKQEGVIQRIMNNYR